MGANACAPPRRHRAAVVLTLGLAIGAVLAGCGPAPWILAALGVGESVRKRESDAAPSASFAAPLSRSELAARGDAERVPVLLELANDDGGSVDVELAFALAPSGTALPAPEAFRPASTIAGLELEGRTSVAPRGLAAPARGATHLLVWDAGADLGALGLGAARVVLRAVAIEGSRRGEPAHSFPFVAGNDPPALALGPLAAVLSDPVILSFTLADTSDDPVDVTLEFKEGDGPFVPLRRATSGTTEGLRAAPEGTAHEFVWASTDSTGGVGRRRAVNVFLRLRPRDPFAAGPEVLAGPFVVDNNVNPVAVLTEPALLPDRTHVVPVGFRPIDQEGNPTAAILQYAVAGEPFPPLPPDIVDPAARALLYRDPERRRALRIATEAPELFVARLVSASASMLRTPDPVAAGLGARLGAGTRVTVLDGALAGEQRLLAAIDFATSSYLLDPDDPLPAAPAPGTRIAFELAPAPGAARASGPAGLGHAIFWDALADLGRRDVSVRLRLTPVDSEVGVAAESFPFTIENGVFALRPGPPSSGTLHLVATADANADGRTDLVVSRVAFTGGGGSRGVAGEQGLTELFAQDPDGVLRPLGEPLPALGLPPLLGDLRGDGSRQLVLGAHFEAVALRSELRTELSAFAAGASGLSGPPLASFARLGMPQAIAPLAGGPAPDLAAIVRTPLGSAVSLFELDPAAAQGFTEVCPPLPAGRAAPRALAAADVLGDDGAPELVVLYVDGPVDIFQADGGGGLVLAATLELPSGAPGPGPGPAPGGGTGPGAPGGGPGGGAPPPELGEPVDVAVADLTGDGLADVAVLGLRGLLVYARLPGGGFAPPAFTAPPGPAFLGGDLGDMALGDFTGDGRTDVVAQDVNRGPLVLFAQTPEGTLEAVDATGPVGPTFNLAAGDLDGNGTLDLALGQFGGSRLALRPPRFGAPAALPVSTTAPQALTGDLDGDGRLDVLISAFSGAAPVLFRGTPGGGFREGPLGVSVGLPLLAADLSGDGRHDLLGIDAFSSPFEARLLLSIQRPDGTFAEPRALPLPPGLGFGSLLVLAADWDGDGQTDLLYTGGLASSPPGLQVALGDGTGGFAAPVPVGGLEEVVPVGAADLDLDGRLDLIAIGAGGALPPGALAVAFRQPASGFELRTLDADANLFDERPAVRDLDGDGWPDLVLGRLGLGLAEAVAVFYGGPARSFEQSSVPHGLAVPGAPRADAADVDGDGQLDLVVGDAGFGTSSPQQLQVLLQTAPRTFARSERFDTPSDLGNGDQPPLVLELTGDGAPDILTQAEGAMGGAAQPRARCEPGAERARVPGRAGRGGGARGAARGAGERRGGAAARPRHHRSRRRVLDADRAARPGHCAAGARRRRAGARSDRGRAGGCGCAAHGGAARAHRGGCRAGPAGRHRRHPARGAGGLGPREPAAGRLGGQHRARGRGAAGRRGAASGAPPAGRPRRAGRSGDRPEWARRRAAVVRGAAGGAGAPRRRRGRLAAGSARRAGGRPRRRPGAERERRLRAGYLARHARGALFRRGAGGVPRADRGARGRGCPPMRSPPRRCCSPRPRRAGHPAAAPR
ncbi:MAG: hypothetical protein KatS3mg102_2256 [Planctomycetota bacterium]|nr:MAG: hypothetical protein KatS3mg102_2256 [Planctomycetota bacterium]